jgi:hypothetical protein
MIQKSPSNLELAIGLPLGVVADKLMRIETELRALNMKALVFANDRDRARVTAQIEAQIEAIYKALDSIESLASDIAANIQARSSDTPADQED